MGHVQTTIKKLIKADQVHALAFFATTSRTEMSYSHSQVDSPFCSNIHHSNESHLTVVKLEHPLAVIT